MELQHRKIIVMAGGTGGHVFPALSVAAELQARGAAVEWLGTARGIEAELVPAADIQLHCLTIEGVRGKGLLTLVKAPFLLLGAVWQAMQVIRTSGADAVLGLGGFASGPGGIAARLLGKPLVIHEQNAVAGTTNRWLSKVANVVLEAFPGCLPEAVHVGNPVRPEIAGVRELECGAERPMHLLVLGGSLGALALNQTVPAALAQLPADERPMVRHQTGKRHIAVTEEAYRQAGVEAQVEAFIEDMAAAYEWADVVICRSGALTVSELTLAGRGALLVPFPFAIDDHQTRNAEWLVNNSAGVLMPQSDMNKEKLAEFIVSVSKDRQQLQTMGRNAKALAMPNAASDVADYCQQVVSRKQEKNHGE